MKRLVLFVLCLSLSTPALAQRLINGPRVITGGLNACLATGASNTYACTLLETFAAYTTRQCFLFQANHTNTGAATLNVNGLGAKTIKKFVAGVVTDLVANDIGNGQVVQVCYDGTNLQLPTAPPPAAGIVSDGDKGDLTVTATGTVWTIDPSVVSLAKMAPMATASLLGRSTAGTGAPEVLSPATAKTVLGLENVDNTSDATKNAAAATLANKTLTTPTIGSFTNATHTHTNAAGGGVLAEGALAFTDVTTGNATTGAHGLLQKLPGGTTTFLRADGTFATPVGGGDITAVGSSTSGEAFTTASSDTNLFFATSAAPSTPSAGKATLYVDSTTKKLSVKDDAGVVSRTIPDIDCTATPGHILKIENGMPSCSTDGGGGGGLTASGTPTSGQIAEWTSSTNLQGVASNGTGAVARTTNAALITPTLGVATVTSVNKVAVTAPATSATLTIANGKTLTASNTLTLAGTDGAVMTFPGTGTVATLDAPQTVTNKKALPREVIVGTGTSLACNVDNADICTQANTQGAGTLTIAAPGGTPTNLQAVQYRITCTANQTYSFNAIFRFSTDMPAPTTCLAGKTDYIGARYNATAVRFDVLAIIQGF